MDPVVARLHRVLRPGGVMLVCFRADIREQLTVQQSFRIADTRTLSIYPKGHRQAAHLLTNRAVERIFERFGSVKFFLSRDSGAGSHRAEVGLTFCQSRSYLPKPPAAR